MIKKIIANVIVFGILGAIVLWVGLFVFGFIYAIVDDARDFPGKAQFVVENKKITVFDGSTVTFGNSPEALTVAKNFSTQLSEMQSAFFTGGSKLNPATSGHFLTYCRMTPTQVIILCHVPDLRGYKDDVLDALAKLAWITAQSNIKSQNLDGNASLVVGLRGFGSYGSVWEGKVVGEPTAKEDGPYAEKRLYPYFIPSAPSH